MRFYPTLEETLAKRFTDNDEVRDISEHGIDGGFTDFIYTYELNRIFDEFEYELEEKLYDVYGESWLMTVAQQHTVTDVQSLKTFMVWFAAEDFCQRKNELLMEAA